MSTLKKLITLLTYYQISSIIISDNQFFRGGKMKTCYFCQKKMEEKDQSKSTSTICKECNKRLSEMFKDSVVEVNHGLDTLQLKTDLRDSVKSR